MTYKEYMEKYHHCFGHEDYECGERMLLSLEELLVELKDGGYACPDEVDGGVPVKMAIDQEDAIDAIEQQLYDHDFAGEDYEIHDLGRLLGASSTKAEGSLQVPLLLARSGDHRAAITQGGCQKFAPTLAAHQQNALPGKLLQFRQSQNGLTVRTLAGC